MKPLEVLVGAMSPILGLQHYAIIINGLYTAYQIKRCLVEYY